MKKLVIVGCGRLAGIVSDAVVNGLLPEYDLVGVYSRTAEKAERIVAKMQQHGKTCMACTTIEELLALKPDYLVEAASPAAMKELALPALKNGTSIVTLSIGALADTAFYQEVIETAQANGTRVYIVSGATGGFDVLRTASLMGNATANRATGCLLRQCNRSHRHVPYQSQCSRCRLTGFCRSRKHANVHAVHPRICGRYAKSRNKE